MPTDDTTSTPAKLPEAYARDADSGETADEPMTISDLKTEAAATQSRPSARSPADPDAETTDAVHGDTHSSGSEPSSDSAETAATTRDMDAIKTEILEGIGRHGNRTWFQLGSYHTSVQNKGKLVKVHLDDGTWYCLLEQHPRRLTTRYMVQAVGTTLTVHPRVPDMETLQTALTTQRYHDLENEQADPVSPLSAKQRHRFTWEYANFTMETLERHRLLAEQSTTDTQLSLYSHYVIATTDASALRTRVGEALSAQQLEVVLATLWKAIKANPAIPSQLFSQSSGRVPLVGRLVFK